MTWGTATGPSEEMDQSIEAHRLRTRFRGQLLDTFLLYLFTYEMPIDRVRLLLDKVETQALRGFPDLAHATWRAEAAEELRDRWVLIENSTVQNETSKIPPKTFGSFPTCPECHLAQVDAEDHHLPTCSKGKPPEAEADSQQQTADSSGEESGAGRPKTASPEGSGDDA